MQILNIRQAASELARMLRRQKPYDVSYILMLIKKRKIMPINPQKPWLIDYDKLQEYALTYEKKLKRDNRVKRHFDL